MECFVEGVDSGAKILSGALFVPKGTTGASIELGGLPKFVTASTTRIAQFGANSPAVCFAPAVGNAIRPTPQSNGYIDMTFSATGLTVTYNAYSADTTLYWLAVM